MGREERIVLGAVWVGVAVLLGLLGLAVWGFIVMVLGASR